MSLSRLGLYRCVRPGALFGMLAACNGGDLTLPVDRTPANITAVGGDGQSGSVGSRLNDPLVVEVTDAAGRPVAGALVVFRFADGISGADVIPPAGETDQNGHAAVEVQLGVEVGTQEVEAQVGTATDLRTKFTLTALAPPGGNDGGGGRHHGRDG